MTRKYTGYTSHELYPIYKNMISRARKDNIESSFALKQEDFEKWLKAIGPKLSSIKNLSIRRYDVSKGYVFDSDKNRWNFRWCEVSNYTSHELYPCYVTMINRAKRDNTECDFLDFRQESFEKFCGVIGPKPVGMKNPSIGRYDHSKGYVFDHDKNRWNFRWQELSENCRENGLLRTHEQLVKAARAGGQAKAKAQSIVLDESPITLGE
jgi:hypothetical protein